MTITLAIISLVALVGLVKVAQFVAWRWRRPVQIPGNLEIAAMNARAGLAGHVHRCRLYGVEFRHRKKDCVSFSGHECTRCASELRGSFWTGSVVGAMIALWVMALVSLFRS